MQTLKSLILMSPLERKRSCHFSRFIGNVINLAPKWASNWCRWVPLRPESWQKWGLENIEKTSPHKYNTCHKYAPKRGFQKVIVWDFLGSQSQYGLQGVPGVAPRPKSISKWRPRHGFSMILGRCFHVILELLWKFFMCSLKNKLIVFDVKFMFMLV